MLVRARRPEGPYDIFLFWLKSEDRRPLPSL